jgi:hypothetical protein
LNLLERVAKLDEVQILDMLSKRTCRSGAAAELDPWQQESVDEILLKSDERL